MSVSERLKDLIEEAAHYWSAEAEICRAYFRSPDRTRESDRECLARQCFKEVWGSGFTGNNEAMLQGFSRKLIEWFPKIDTEIDRREALEIAEALHEEFEHYCLFADAYDAMAAPDEPKLTPMALKDLNWSGDHELSELRREHRAEHGAIGWRACRFSEGGYCTVLSEGAALADDPDGHDGRNALIAAASQAVYDDEFAHMLHGVVEVDEAGMNDEEWALFRELSLEQLRARLPMRNEQFGYPVPEDRMAELMAGRAEPMPFDWDKAKLAA